MSLINQIILLQEVDNKLFEIEKLLGDLPAKVEELTKNEDDIKTSLLNKENELKETSVYLIHHIVVGVVCIFYTFYYD